eukprot:COSAG06_NODE_48902_length_329_cov_0.591304_1_plen_22_part_10
MGGEKFHGGGGPPSLEKPVLIA